MLPLQAIEKALLVTQLYIAENSELASPLDPSIYFMLHSYVSASACNLDFKQVSLDV